MVLRLAYGVVKVYSRRQYYRVAHFIERVCRTTFLQVIHHLSKGLGYVASLMIDVHIKSKGKMAA